MPSRGRILIVDDEANARAALSEILREDGYTTETAADGFKGLGKLEEFGPDVVLTDLKMPGLDGIRMMEKAHEVLPDTTFVVMTAFGTISSAVEAVKKGAYNYLTKPLDFAVLAVVVERAVERARLLQENSRLRERLRERNAFGHFIASHPSMVKLLRLVEQVAPSRASVLLIGETGTGKELVAEMIHRSSPRARAPFVRLNCAALSESLLESELFGHERGAFTGAIGRREGRFEQANGGTLFLDEVSEIPLATQVKLLRFLQERSFERVGGNETLKVDVRILAASNRDLRQRIQEGLFREDLYYRLNVVTLEIPPLRERGSDIPELATFFLGRYAQENGKRLEGFSDESLQALLAYPFPGNVRELENLVERAVVLCDGPRIEIAHLPAALNTEPQAAPDVMPQVPGSTIYELERFAILRTLEACKGSTSKAATILGISPRKIQYKLHEYSAAKRAEGREGALGPIDGAGDGQDDEPRSRAGS
ncbi:sigma-54-dependent transcriptional regulator [Chondromyces crocatus]|uniref:Fis family transcriptional regulator n=1 Tax=Chondromyces crocatus TaxID=52 RepID=A0A0K1ED42_CHOCO|nr:sigma-54 dependent transcriptional regulator [Chondromyces crocatus]AKT38764.1 Fis family transcriptional regulator [Chondromyces crocatus]